MRQLRIVILAVSLLGFAAPAAAEMYKWVDENGITHYGDRVPPQYAKQQREVLNKQGDTIEVLQHEMTPEERAEQARLEELEHQKEAQAKRDRILLDMYGSEEDLAKARDDQLESLDGTIKIIEISMQGTEKDLETRQQRAADLQKQGKPVPDNLQKQIQSLEKRLASDRKALEQRQKERAALSARFDRDIQRWRQLRGISVPTASTGSAADQGADTGVGK